MTTRLERFRRVYLECNFKVQEKPWWVTHEEPVFLRPDAVKLVAPWPVPMGNSEETLSVVMIDGMSDKATGIYVVGDAGQVASRLVTGDG